MESKQTVKAKVVTLAELREKSVAELEEVILDSKKQLFDLRIKKATQKLENTAQIKNLKKVVAQAKTVITEKEGK